MKRTWPNWNMLWARDYFKKINVKEGVTPLGQTQWHKKEIKGYEKH